MGVLQNRDERVIAADEAIEVAVASLLAGDNNTDRVGALRLLTQRIVRKNRTNKIRPRSANE